LLGLSFWMVIFVLICAFCSKTNTQINNALAFLFFKAYDKTCLLKKKQFCKVLVVESQLFFFVVRSSECFIHRQGE
jgi:hypothetical protein